MDKKDVVRKLMDGVWNQGNTKVAEECIAADCRTHDPSVPNAQPGPGVLVEQMKTYRGAFPDMKMTLDQQFADGDCVITRWTCRGTHTGSLAGAPASQTQGHGHGDPDRQVPRRQDRRELGELGPRGSHAADRCDAADRHDDRNERVTRRGDSQVAARGPNCRAARLRATIDR